MNLELQIKKDQIRALPEYKELPRYKKVEFMSKKLYGENYYSRIGSIGAKNGNNRPFLDKEFAKKAAKISAEKRLKK